MQKYSAYLSFCYGFKSDETKKRYIGRLDRFFSWLGYTDEKFEDKIQNAYDTAIKDTSLFQSQIMEFIIFLRGKKIVAGTVNNYVKAIKLFCEMNDIVLNWRKIAKGQPTEKKYGDDRPPTMQEIQKTSKYPDRRIISIISVMISSGIRVGAWDYLKWKHINPVYRNGVVVAAKMTVYAGDREEYFTFISPEAYSLLLGWMDYRASFGENITGESWLMRDLWASINGKGNNKNAKQLKSSFIRILLYRAQYAAGVRQANSKEVKAAHGYRKFFKTQCEQVMKPANVELLMGHRSSLGVSASYYKPDESQILDDYLNAVNLLTINEENRLKVENEKMRQELDDTDRKFLRLETKFAKIAKMMGLEN